MRWSDHSHTVDVLKAHADFHTGQSWGTSREKLLKLHQNVTVMTWTLDIRPDSGAYWNRVLRFELALAKGAPDRILLPEHETSAHEEPNAGSEDMYSHGRIDRAASDGNAWKGFSGFVHYGYALVLPAHWVTPAATGVGCVASRSAEATSDEPGRDAAME
ncbi:hypothetical protein K491DRAFT_735608 [Lophiostoma macrostomum CBS 122681]|uniref:Uncharacterized protein n=1 Tax=Lophiostoma macrostomum CBS 122681 TaxID=1314788 RepID=A0A6A6TGV9_9PLEO|nr:hypothetical protein K491DRAFT_735608 [Lophiostoma macrostomum CBS 122681]